MHHSSHISLHPHTVTAAEVVPGDLLALSEQEAAEHTWYAVMHTVPEGPETIGVTLRPPLGGTDHDEAVTRSQDVTVAGHRMDVAAIPLVTSSDLGRTAFRDGDRVTSLRAVDPRAAEQTYVRRWGVWYRDLESPAEQPLTDAELRELT